MAASAITVTDHLGVELGEIADGHFDPVLAND